MKILKYSYGLLVALLVLATSCTDFVEPRIPYKTFDTATYLRTIARTSDSFNFFDLQSSKFALTLEAVDIEDGATVSTVEIRVRHRRLIPGVGLEYTPTNDVLVKTLSASDFGPNPNSRFLRTSFEVAALDAITAVGLTPAQIEGGDTFEFRLVLTTTNGRVFSSDNRSSDVAGGFFYASPFLYNVGVVCPTALGGTYAFSTVVTNSPYARSCEGKVLTGTISLTPVTNSTAYTISDGSFGMFDCSDSGWGAGNLRLNDSCGILNFTGADKYGSTYTFTFVSNDGKNLVFDWITTDNEASRTTLIAPAGFTWPSTLR
ncbi:hypothetical protein P872_06910 [Rhodonellum psychrophilum GCM71 = DSM 17998]|uniref:DUF1735 domain-containing protein n=2 Tax=Rhodonellum TaxID=336827 RepID=U5BZ82_9BACT|nr:MULTISPECIES: hypothetical protein [Rhodonellum]ERM81971.1 hypothetical protein P872_06910 [Rhodonellum psychrophilum GCM71 = DSM 17998]MDO9553699.1 hypothetical protein [Rhodonellum sp.]SDY69618.1 hypothetical protein SAMN05444412_102274 [Rhodonellum ikkaensis]